MDTCELADSRVMYQPVSRKTDSAQTLFNGYVPTNYLGVNHVLQISLRIVNTTLRYVPTLEQNKSGKTG